MHLIRNRYWQEIRNLLKFLIILQGFDRSPSSAPIPSSNHKVYTSTTAPNTDISSAMVTSLSMMTSVSTSLAEQQSPLYMNSSKSTATEVAHSGFQPYKSPSLNDVSKHTPHLNPSPFPSPYGYPPALFAGHQIHSYRYFE